MNVAVVFGRRCEVWYWSYERDMKALRQQLETRSNWRHEQRVLVGHFQETHGCAGAPF